MRWCVVAATVVSAALVSCGGGWAWVGPGGQPMACPALPSTQTLLQALNQARATPRACGAAQFAAAGPLQWNDALAAAALAHSTDMANQNYFSHTSLDGRTLIQRVQAAGYAGLVLAENIAGGEPSAESALASWLASPQHCANIMNPNLHDYGIACASNNSSDFGTYWTQNFGSLY